MHRPDAAVRDPHLGREVGGRFLLDRRLGVGAMGVVYRATDRRTGERAAVKILREELAGDWSLVERFQREARAARAIDSPHVVRILDHGSSGDLQFIAMEWLDGESLGTRLERAGAMPVHLAVRTARAVANALGAAHAAGVVHRDLKPENVMLTADGGVKVVDFGIARILEGSGASSDPVAPLTLEGVIMGTPQYISPEAAAREKVGPPADLYALGVILYETLCGEPPFTDDSPMAVIGMHLSSAPPSLQTAAPGLNVPPALADLVERLLAKQPEDRPTAAEARSSLDAVAVELDATTPARALPETEAPDTLEERPLNEILGDDPEGPTAERRAPPGYAGDGAATAVRITDPGDAADDATTLERHAPPVDAIHSEATAVPRRDPPSTDRTWVMPARRTSRAPLLVAVAVIVLLLAAFAALLAMP